jgi:transposase-like protein
MEKKKLVSREELKKFIKENKMTTAEDVQNMLKDLFAETLQEMLEAEMDATLGYERNNSKNKQTTNRRNGIVPRVYAANTAKLTSRCLVTVRANTYL